jgi:acyl-CoA thioester hydrolase
MSRVKIDLPAHFLFTTDIPVRITDLNYGGHVGNDTVLSIIHEARVRFLVSKGYSELNVDGAGLIMSDVCIQFKNELFYGDIIRISVAVTDFSKVSFEVYYLLETLKESERKTVAIAKTGMLCYDYNRKKIAAVPESFKQACSS